jgi:tetratricopeptide (TPR) repeat protein
MLLIASKKYDEARAEAEKVLVANQNNAQAHSILGDQFALRGDSVGAIREYRIAIKLDPGQVESYSGLAAVFTVRRELPDAEAILKQAVTANPQSLAARLNFGRFYLSQRKFAQAEAEVGAASTLAPRDPLPRLLLANAYVAEGNLAEAEKSCAELKAIAPDDPAAYRALAWFYVTTRQREKAAAELKLLRASKVRDPWVKAYLAETLLALDRVQEAAVPTQELLSADPGDARALVLKGRILLLERKYSEARTILENAATRGGAPNSAAYYFLGIAQKSMGLADVAEVSFAEAHKLSPGTIGPEALLAELEASSGAYDKAERLAKANPNVPIADIVGAQAELAKGNLRNAEQLVEAALEHDPVSLSALEILVMLYAKEGRAQEAIRKLSTLVSRYPQNAGLHFLLALGYFDGKDFQKSEASVRQALALDPQTPDAHAMLAAIDSARGLTGLAVTEFRAELEASTYKSSNYLTLARLYEADGKWQDAQATLEKAHARDSSSPYVDNNLAYLYLEHGGDVYAALPLAQEARRALPNSPVVADTLGWTYYKLGLYELAITQLSAASQKLPDHAEYQYHLGMANLRAGRFEAARQSFRRALRSHSNFADASSAKAALDTIAERSRK